jgi:phage baseplate assembly protein V
MNAAVDVERLAMEVHGLRIAVAELSNKLRNSIRYGHVTDVDAKRQMCRVEVGTEEEPHKTAWVPYALGFAGAFKMIWHPSKGQNMCVIAPGGQLAQACAYPFTYCKQYPTPSDDERCHILCDFGTSRIEVWEEKIVIKSDHIISIANKTIEETAHDLIAEKVTKGDITNDADRSISLVTRENEDGSTISLKTGSPEKAASTITIETGDPKQGDSKLSIKTGSPSETGKSAISVVTGDPKTGDSTITVFAGSPETGNSIIDVRNSMPRKSGYANIHINSQMVLDVRAGLEIDLTAPEVALIGMVDLGAKGGRAVARIGDATSDGALITTGSPQVHAT